MPCIEHGEYRISSTPDSWLLEVNTGKHWKVEGYYSSLGGVMAGLMERKIRCLPATTWEELASGLREIRQELKAIEKQLSFQN